MREIHKSFLFLALLLLSFSSHAQYFDWVKTYSGQDRGSGGYNNISTGIVNDSEGNIYYLGDFGLGAGIDTTHFLPFAPSVPGRNTSGTVIAKFSPSGSCFGTKSSIATMDSILQHIRYRCWGIPREPLARRQK